MAKVLLIQPHNDIRGKKERNNPPVPLSLIYIGTSIEDKHSVKIYDRNLNVNDQDFLNFLEEFDPQIVGLTTMATEMLIDLIHLGKLIKQKKPDIILVVGGVHPTIEPDSVLNEPYIDYIIRGEGEEAFLEFCDVFDKNPKKLKKLKNINYNSLRPYIDINSLKIPNYGLVDLKKYGPFYINLSRGCPGNCTFCSNPRIWGKNGRPFIRSLSPEKSVELFRELIKKYNLKVFSIIDDNFTTFRSRTIKVCEFLKKYNLQFFCFSRVDYLDDEILKALKKAGCHTIQIGAESGSQRILNFLNKQTTVEKNKEIIQKCKKYGIICDASFMIGLPTETIEDLNKTRIFIKKTKPEIVNLKIYDPLPGAPLFDYVVSKGLIKKPRTLKEWAVWTGSMDRINHNVSAIPDKILNKTAEELWKTSFYKTKLKKFMYWMSVGEFRYVLSGAKRLFIDKGKIRLPFTGDLFDFLSKKNRNDF